jgi:hypothetical protein
VTNATVSKSTGTTYNFEVASDAAFANKVWTRNDVAEGSGQTSVQLGTLQTGTYYWHASAKAGGTNGAFGTAFKFTIGAAITFTPPAPLAPLTGAQTAPRPSFRVGNVTVVGSAGAITYKFDVASDAGFNNIVASGTQPQGAGETDWVPSSDLPASGTLYWRATAMDQANSVTGPASTSQSFTVVSSQASQVAAQEGIVLWPGIQPTGTLGHATMGDMWNIQTLHYVPENAYFQSPDAEMLRIFDLLDRGFDPVGAINWMNANGYPTQAVWYPGPEKAVIGLHYVYLASRNKIVTNGTWEVVLRVE